ncbi:MAG TPA: hypothetical protein VFF02_19950, partial [Anaeromyxobacteraceae bacterium]|nr:hypothetical protein [Anaeromyxobacteraceae bacterium]
MTSERTIGTVPRKPSLRWRLRGWTIAVFSLTLAAFAVVSVLDERGRVLEFEATSARAFLGHLAGMPAFGAGLAELI